MGTGTGYALTNSAIAMRSASMYLAVMPTARWFRFVMAWAIAGLSLFQCIPCMAGLPATIARIKPSVVGVGTVERMRTPPLELLGTGFVVADGRHVLTNAHVVAQPLDEQNYEFFAVFSGHGTHPQVRKAKKVAVDYEHDLALLKISGPPLPTVRLGDSDRVREGQSIAFTGFPIGAILGLYPATAHGIVSAITPIVIPAMAGKRLTPERIRRLRTPYDVFQLDATAYPGNSGSPLFDPTTGKVLAIVNMVFVKGTKESVLSHPSGIAYAIPIRYAEALLRKAGLGAGPGRTGR